MTSKSAVMANANATASVRRRTMTTGGSPVFSKANRATRLPPVAKVPACRRLSYTASITQIMSAVGYPAHPYCRHCRAQSVQIWNSSPSSRLLRGLSALCPRSSANAIPAGRNNNEAIDRRAVREQKSASLCANRTVLVAVCLTVFGARQWVDNKTESDGLATDGKARPEERQPLLAPVS